MSHECMYLLRKKLQKYSLKSKTKIFLANTRKSFLYVSLTLPVIPGLRVHRRSTNIDRTTIRSIVDLRWTLFFDLAALGSVHGRLMSVNGTDT